MRLFSAVIISAAALLAGWLATTAPPIATAQTQPAAIDFVIRVLICDNVPARGPGMAAEDPEGCRRLDGASVGITTDDGRPIAICITGQSRPGWGDCHIDAPYDTYVVVTEDVATLPPGYRPDQNPKRTLAYTEFAGAIFVNVPVTAANATPPAPTTLPNTGTGPVIHEASPSSLPIAGLAIVIAAIVLLRNVTAPCHAKPTA